MSRRATRGGGSSSNSSSNDGGGTDSGGGGGAKASAKPDPEACEVMNKLRKDKDKGIKAAFEYVSKLNPSGVVKWVMEEDMTAFPKILRVRSTSKETKLEGFKLIYLIAKAIQQEGPAGADAQSKLGEAGFCEALELLYEIVPNQTEQFRLWCEAMEALCAGHRQNRDRFGKETQAVQHLLSAMFSYCYDHAFQVQALKTIISLSTDMRGPATSEQGGDDDNGDRDDGVHGDGRSGDDNEGDNDRHLPAALVTILKAFRTHSAPRSVVRILRTWPGDRETQELGCHCVCNLAMLQGNRSLLGDLGAITVILTALERFKDESMMIRKWGLRALANLIRDQPANLERLIDVPEGSSLVPASTLWLVQKGSRACLAGVAVIKAVARLVDSSSRDGQSRYRTYQSAMIQEGGLTDVLSAVMGCGFASDDWKLQADMCEIIIDLAKDEENRARLNNVPSEMLMAAAKAITSCPKDHASYLHVCRNGCWAINYLTMRQLDRQADVVSVLSAILRAIQDHPTNQDVNQLAYRAVVHLVKFNSKAEWFAQSDLPPLLVKGMTHVLDQPHPQKAPSSGSRIPTASNLMNEITAAIDIISKDDKKNQARLREAGTFAPLARVLKAYPSSPDILKQACGAISNLVSSSPDAACEALKAGVKDACTTIKKDMNDAYNLAQEICKCLDSTKPGGAKGLPASSCNGGGSAMVDKSGDKRAASKSSGGGGGAPAIVRMEVDNEQVVQAPKTQAVHKRPRSPPLPPSSAPQPPRGGLGAAPPTRPPATRTEPCPPLPLDSAKVHRDATIEDVKGNKKHKEGGGGGQSSPPVTSLNPVTARFQHSPSPSEHVVGSSSQRREVPTPDKAPSPKRPRPSIPPSSSVSLPEPRSGSLPTTAAAPNATVARSGAPTSGSLPTKTAAAPSTNTVAPSSAPTTAVGPPSDMLTCCRCSLRHRAPGNGLKCLSTTSPHFICADCLPKYVRELLFCPTGLHRFAMNSFIPCPGDGGPSGSNGKCVCSPWPVPSIEHLLVSRPDIGEGKEVLALLRNHIAAGNEQGAKRRELWQKRKKVAKKAEDEKVKVELYRGVMLGRDVLDLLVIHCPHCWREINKWEDGVDQVVCCAYEGKGADAVLVGCGTALCPWCMKDGVDNINLHMSQEHGCRLDECGFEKVRAACVESNVVRFLKGLNESDETKMAVLYECADDLAWFGVAPEVVARAIKTKVEGGGAASR